MAYTRKNRIQALTICAVLAINLVSSSASAGETSPGVMETGTEALPAEGIPHGEEIPDLTESDVVQSDEWGSYYETEAGIPVDELFETEAAVAEDSGTLTGDAITEYSGTQTGETITEGSGVLSEEAMTEDSGVWSGEVMTEDTEALSEEAITEGSEVQTGETMTETPGSQAGETMTEAPETLNWPEFDQFQVLDGARISVKAPEGAFPANAVLSVSRAAKNEQNQADMAVGQVRDETRNVAASYTYDIKVVDPDTGEELQPSGGQKVEVHFSMAQAADENLEAQVYHITEDERTGQLVAEELEVKEDAAAQAELQDQESAADELSADEVIPDEGTVSGISPDAAIQGVDGTGEMSAGAVIPAERALSAASEGALIPAESAVVVETDGFSFYTVEFTYNHLEYVLPGGDSVALSDILAKAGLTGDVSDAYVSAPELFTVSRQEGTGAEWMVTALQPFNTLQWLKVTINGVEYEITVTDDMQHVQYLYRDEKKLDGETRECSSYTLVSPANKPEQFSNGWYVFQGLITYENRCTITGNNVNFILTDGCTISGAEGIHISPGCRLNIYGQNNGNGILRLVSSKNSPLGGNQADNEGDTRGSTASLTINGGTIEATGKSGAAAIGAGRKGSFGSITINGGTVTAQGGSDAAGIGGSEYGGPIAIITINGGKVTARGGDKYGAGIGGGDRSTDGGEIIITGGNVDSVGGGGNDWHYALAQGQGAAIGGGRDRTGPSKITISGGTVRAEGSWRGAGIGGGCYGSSGDITITGGDIKALCGDESAGIGGGKYRGIGDGKRVLITGGKVTVTVGTKTGSNDGVEYSGAGIGGGFSAPQGGDVIIRGGEVSAESWYGAGIGGGGNCGKPGGNVIISGGNVAATSKGGAGIGGGGNSHGYSNTDDRGDGGNVTISGGSVYTSSTNGGAAIGGGAGRDGGSVTITGGFVVATTGSVKYDWVDNVKQRHIGGNATQDFFATLFHFIWQKTFSHSVDKSPAAIGGGYATAPRGGSGGTFKMTGGTLIANSALNEVAAIGKASDGDKNGTYSLSDNLMVEYSDDIKAKDNKSSLKVATSDERYKILKAKPYVVISECQHTNVTYNNITAAWHSGQCDRCREFLGQQPHRWDESGLTCLDCGFKRSGVLGAKLSDPTSSYVYTGKAIRPDVIVTLSGQQLYQYFDYNVSYSNNVKAGKATIKVTLNTPKYSADIAPVEVGFNIRKAHFERVIFTPSSYQYDGSSHQVPSIKVMHGEQEVNSNSQSGDLEYTIESSSGAQTNAGSYPVTVKSLERNYTGSLTAYWKIVPRELKDNSSFDFILSPGSYTYDGTAKTPAVMVIDKGLKSGQQTIKEGTDYTVSYRDNVNAGQGTVVITGQGNYTGTVEKSFTIQRAAITDVVLAKNELACNGTRQKVSVLKVLAETSIQSGFSRTVEVPLSDCIISGDSGVNPGNYTLTVNTKNSSNYAGPYSLSWSITGEMPTLPTEHKEIYSNDITAALSETEFVFDGEDKTPFVTVKDGDATLAGALKDDISPDQGTGTSGQENSSWYEGLDYTYEYSNNVYPGLATVTITGRGKYTGTRTLTFNISKARIDHALLSENFLFYSGEEQTLELVVTAGGMRLYESSYTVSGDAVAVQDSDNDDIVTILTKKDAGDYKVTVTANANSYYTGSVTVPYYILPRGANAFNVQLSETEYIYDGTPKTPEVIVTDRERILTEGKDYTLEYLDNTDAGTAKVMITGRGSYQGTRTLPYTISKAQLEAVYVQKNILKDTGSKQTVEIGTVYAEGTGAKDHIVPPEYYTVTGNTASYPGSYELTVRAKDQSNYTGFVNVPYTIVSQDAAVFTAKLATSDEQIYDGSPKEPTVIVEDSGRALAKDTDYTVIYQDNVNAGYARIYVIGNGNYDGIYILRFPIKKAPIKYVRLKEESPLTYNGKLQTVTVQEVRGGTADSASEAEAGSGRTWLTVPKEDYTLSGGTARSPGQYEVKVTAKEQSNFTGSASAVFSIQPDNGLLWADLQDTEFIYDGREKRPELRLYDDDYLLVEGKDYELSYSDNINAGVAAIIVRFLGKYARKDKNGNDIIYRYSFVIEEAEIDTVVLENDGILTYNGQDQSPVVTKVMSRGLNVPKNDYTVDVSPERGIGTYELTVSVTDRDSNFTGSKTATWRIDKNPEPEVLETEAPAQSESEPAKAETAETEADVAFDSGTPAPLWLYTTGQKKHSIDLAWTGVPGAVKYAVYGAPCGEKMKKLRKLGNVNRFMVKKAGSKLRQGRYYKFRVTALDKRGRVIEKSKVIHVVTKGGAFTNFSRVKVKDSVIRRAAGLRPGRKLKLKARAVKQDGSLEAEIHRGMRYVSDNRKVASVSRSGVIKAKAPGSCLVYAYTQSGTFTCIKVVVEG